MSKQSVLQEMADRAEVELTRVAVARPALGTRCERAKGILANHAVSPRGGIIRAQLRGGELLVGEGAASAEIRKLLQFGGEIPISDCLPALGHPARGDGHLVAQVFYLAR